MCLESITWRPLGRGHPWAAVQWAGTVSGRREGQTGDAWDGGTDSDRNALATTNSSRGDCCWEELTRAEPWRSAHLDRVEPCKPHGAVEGFQVNMPAVCRDDGRRKSGELARPQASSHPHPGKGVGMRSCVQAVGRSAERPQAAPDWVTADTGAKGEHGSKLLEDQPSRQSTEERRGTSLNQSTRRRHKRPESSQIFKVRQNKGSSCRSGEARARGSPKSTACVGRGSCPPEKHSARQQGQHDTHGENTLQASRSMGLNQEPRATCQRPCPATEKPC